MNGINIYGYNGMEQDDYLKENNQYLTTNPAFARTGTGNSYDYGARMYDSRVGRFMSRDPLEKKHPDKSSYSSFANNPILYIDKDGEDYSIYIDHMNKTITVKATYLAINSKSHNILDEALKAWNKMSDKFEYISGDGESQSKYIINFELTQITSEKAEGKIFIENQGPINKFEALNVMEYNDFVKGKIIDGSAGYAWVDDIKIDLDANKKNPQNIMHEIGHNIGITHQLFGWGLMTKNANTMSIWSEYFNDILGQAGIGVNKGLKGGNRLNGKENAEYMGRPIGPDYDRNTNKLFETGLPPDNFDNGEVKKK